MLGIANKPISRLNVDRIAAALTEILRANLSTSCQTVKAPSEAICRHPYMLIRPRRSCSHHCSPRSHCLHHKPSGLGCSGRWCTGTGCWRKTGRSPLRHCHRHSHHLHRWTSADQRGGLTNTETLRLSFHVYE